MDCYCIDDVYEAIYAYCHTCSRCKWPCHVCTVYTLFLNSAKNGGFVNEIFDIFFYKYKVSLATIKLHDVKIRLVAETEHFKTPKPHDFHQTNCSCTHDRNKLGINLLLSTSFSLIHISSFDFGSFYGDEAIAKSVQVSSNWELIRIIRCKTIIPIMSIVQNQIIQYNIEHQHDGA